MENTEIEAIKKSNLPAEVKEMLLANNPAIVGVDEEGYPIPEKFETKYIHKGQCRNKKHKEWVGHNKKHLVDEFGICKTCVDRRLHESAEIEAEMSKIKNSLKRKAPVKSNTSTLYLDLKAKLEKLFDDTWR